MATEKICPYCGAPIGNPASTKCDSCGNALTPTASSDATMISPRGAFNSSAEVMDEVKKLTREGNSQAAAEVLGTEFGLNQEAAHQTAEQVGFDMQFEGSKSSSSAQGASGSNSHPEVISAPASQSTPQPSNRRNWIVGGSVGAAIILCCCCLLPILAFFLKARGQ